MPTTKPSRPKSAQTTAKPETAADGTPKDTISTTENGSCADPVSVTLTPFQEFLVDTFADMLLREADEDDLENLIHALAGHFWRRGYTYGSPEQIHKDVGEYRVKHYREWVNKIEAARPPRLVDLSSPGMPKAPEAVAKRAGANLRNMLERELEGFLDTAAPQELWFLHEVMTIWNSISCTFPDEMMKVSIATAFLAELHEAEDEYVHVPYEVKELVLKYIAMVTRGRATAA